MKSQIYLHITTRNIFKSTIFSYQKVLNDRLFSNFENIEIEAEKYASDYYNELGKQPANDTIDMSDIADIALDKSIEFYEELSYVKYAFTATCISGIYHIWEQQVRKFLYDELRHDFSIDFSEFCNKGIEDIKKIFYRFNLNIEKLKCWPKLDELRLLSNVIKHGDGKSLKALKSSNEKLFKKYPYDDLYNRVIDSTLLEENLNIDQKLFIKYCEVLVNFWEELPERSYTEEI